MKEGGDRKEREPVEGASLCSPARSQASSPPPRSQSNQTLSGHFRHTHPWLVPVYCRVSPLFSSTITWLFRIDYCNLPPQSQATLQYLRTKEPPPLKSLQILGTPSFQLPLLTRPLCLLFFHFLCVKTEEGSLDSGQKHVSGSGDQ